MLQSAPRFPRAACPVLSAVTRAPAVIVGSSTPSASAERQARCAERRHRREHGQRHMCTHRQQQQMETHGNMYMHGRVKENIVAKQYQLVP